MPTIEVEDIRIAFEDRGPVSSSGRSPVLFLHGAVQTRAIWAVQVDALAEVRRVVVPDLRGHGDTSLGHACLTVERMAMDAFGLLDALAIPRIAVCGVSLGGMVALEMAARSPQRVSSLILANTPMSLASTRWLRRFIDRLDPQDVLPIAFGLFGQKRAAKIGLAIASKVVGPHWVGEKARRHFIHGFETMRPEAIVATYRAIVEARPVDLADIRCPTLLIEGEDDAPSIKAQMDEIAEEADRAQVETVPGGHVASLDDPQGFNRLLVRFFDRQDRAGA